MVAPLPFSLLAAARAAGLVLVLSHCGTELSWGCFVTSGWSGGSSESKNKEVQGTVGLNYEEIKSAECVQLD